MPLELANQERLIFEVSGLNFSIALASVEEIVPSNMITRIPNAPPFFLGLSAVRGKIVGVIDSALRYGLPPSLNSYLMVCNVRGNLTAVTIDRPVVAGALNVRLLQPMEFEFLRAKDNLNPKFVKTGFELLETTGDINASKATGIFCYEVNPDLFVSAQMAGTIGEAA